MAKKKSFHRSKAFTLPIAPMVGLFAGLVNPIKTLAQGNWDSAVSQIGRNYIGFDYQDSSFDMTRMGAGLFPLVLGLLIHKFVGGKLGLNRMLASAGVPIIRI